VQGCSNVAHGSFELMIQEKLSFGPRTAERLMVVAHNSVLANTAHARLLPVSMGDIGHRGQ
jgi:hypothetical protein